MKLIIIFGVILLFCSRLFCNTNAPYDYKVNGADWGKIFQDCAVEAIKV